jgi:hypothetical protein
VATFTTAEREQDIVIARSASLVAETPLTTHIVYSGLCNLGV